jgi:hypothetical protein
MRIAIQTVIILGFVILTTGCAEKKASHPVTPADSPKTLITNCVMAMHKIDTPTFLACFDATAKEREALSNLMDLAQAMTDFKKSFISAYGEEKWSNFQDPEKAPEEGNATFKFVTKEALTELESIDIEIDGDEARIPIPGEIREAVAIKHQDGWLIDATSFLPSGSKPEAFGDLMYRMANVTRKYMKAIGHKGIAPEDIDAEVGRAWAKEMFGMTTPTKHRFNIEEL